MGEGKERFSVFKTGQPPIIEPRKLFFVHGFAIIMRFKPGDSILELIVRITFFPHQTVSGITNGSIAIVDIGGNFFLKESLVFLLEVLLAQPFLALIAGIFDDVGINAFFTFFAFRLFSVPSGQEVGASPSGFSDSASLSTTGSAADFFGLNKEAARAA